VPFGTGLVHGFACVASSFGRQTEEAHTSTDTVVQDRRFVILENFGCQAAVGDYLPALVIVWLPPLCISIIGIFFCRGLTRYDYYDHPADP
jgi:Pheromone A receptor